MYSLRPSCLVMPKYRPISVTFLGNIGTLGLKSVSITLRNGTNVQLLNPVSSASSSSSPFGFHSSKLHLVMDGIGNRAKFSSCHILSMAMEAKSQKEQQENQHQKEEGKQNEEQNEEKRENNSDNEQKAKTFVEKMRVFVKKYGIIGLCVYFSLYFMTLGGLYIAVANKWINAEKVIQTVKNWGLGALISKESEQEVREQKKEGSSTKVTSFLVAWGLAKITEPIRFALTLAITPAIVRFLRKIKS